MVGGVAVDAVGDVRELVVEDGFADEEAAAPRRPNALGVQRRGRVPMTSLGRDCRGAFRVALLAKASSAAHAMASAAAHARAKASRGSVPSSLAVSAAFPSLSPLPRERSRHNG